jgi:sodium/bile acid cotransporter 7
MASVIFAGQGIGAIVLPLMLFHQVQLMACAVIAQKYADAAHRATASNAAEAERLQEEAEAASPT